MKKSLILSLFLVISISLYSQDTIPLQDNGYRFFTSLRNMSSPIGKKITLTSTSENEKVYEMVFEEEEKDGYYIDYFTIISRYDQIAEFKYSCSMGRNQYIGNAIFLGSDLILTEIYMGTGSSQIQVFHNDVKISDTEFKTKDQKEFEERMKNIGRN